VPIERYFEDLDVGMTFGSSTYVVSADEIIAFARQYDPQPFHTDPAAAAQSAFGRLVASGWHTAAITMRLLVASEFRPAGGSIGAGADSLQWPRPVVPGDVLRLDIEVAALRPSRSKPDRGVLTLRVRTRNADGEVVQDLSISSIIPRRPLASA
jgi:acyl dehydratase